METGVSRESSHAFSAKTGISVSAESGVNIGVSATATVNVSLELGYEHRYGDTVFSNASKTQELEVPPHSSGTLWDMEERLIPVRCDGSPLGSDAELTFQVDAYVTGEHPPAAGVRMATPPARD